MRQNRIVPPSHRSGKGAFIYFPLSFVLILVCFRTLRPDDEKGPILSDEAFLAVRQILLMFVKDFF